MAIDLPTPLNRILTLFLPPDFTQKDENTLGYHLRQSDLTWEDLVVSIPPKNPLTQATLHVFSKNLLVPCAYPNPFPSLDQFDLPLPPLPSHFPPQKIYTFCQGLYSLLQQIHPGKAYTRSERWGLVQRVPSAQGAGDWFTSNVDAREVGSKGGSLLEELAAHGDRFGKRPVCNALTQAMPLLLRHSRPLEDPAIRPHSAMLSSSGPALR
jgi:hypothetical protein